MQIVAKILSVGLCFVVCGCGHNIYLLSRTTGMQGTTNVKGGGGGGPIAITLGPRTYTGRWIYAAQGGSVGFGTATGFAGGQTATASGTFVGLPTGGNGTVLASASDGSTLRCVFNYSEWSTAGSGVCQDSHGEMFDMQIN
jgi:hypothetical protein